MPRGQKQQSIEKTLRPRWSLGGINRKVSSLSDWLEYSLWTHTGVRINLCWPITEQLHTFMSVLVFLHVESAPRQQVRMILYCFPWHWLSLLNTLMVSLTWNNLHVIYRLIVALLPFLYFSRMFKAVIMKWDGTLIHQIGADYRDQIISGP